MGLASELFSRFHTLQGGVWMGKDLWIPPPRVSTSPFPQFHKCGGTIDSKKNKYTQFLSKRNRVLFVWKNITSKSLFISHIFWLLLRPNFKVLKSVWKFLPEIRNRRAIEIKEQMLKEFLKQAKYFRQKSMSAMLQKTLKGEIWKLLFKQVEKGHDWKD